MQYVRMAVSLYGKATGAPGYLQHPPVEWDEEDMIEGYVLSGGDIVLEIHRKKVKVDEARRRIPQLEQDVRYFNGQISKIRKEAEAGLPQRKDDIDRFEIKVAEIELDIRNCRETVDKAVVDTFKFNKEDCD